MNDVLSHALELQHTAHELMYLGVDGEPIYSDTFMRLNKDILVKCDTLFPLRGSGSEEEAHLCLSLLMGYNATIYDYGDKEQKKQQILHRSCQVLPHLSPSLLKVRLLAYCYAEVYEEDLLQEARSIIASWDSTTLTDEQTLIIAELTNIAENPYPFEEIE